jgi:sulfur relay (sulfurtransferase) DsrC/TusE family protein
MRRREFDPQSAAEYLGCSVEELSFHLHKGAIRLGIATEGLDHDFAVLLEDLPLRVQREVTGVLADGKFVDIMQPITMDQVPTSAFNPSYIYLSRENKQLLSGSSHGQIIQEFQSLDGQPLTIWLNGELGSTVIKRLHLVLDDEGWITHTTITKEELDRFSGRSVERDPEPKPVFAVPPEKPNEQSWIIVKYANQYFEEFGKIPKPKAFAKYLEQHAKGDGFRIRSDEEIRDPDTKPSERYKYDLNDYGMSERSLGRALREYQIKDETTN